MLKRSSKYRKSMILKVIVEVKINKGTLKESKSKASKRINILEKDSDFISY